MFPSEAEEVDENQGGNSDEEKRSPTCGHSLLHGELAGAMKSQMVYTSSYTDIGRSKLDVDAVQNAKMPLMLEKSRCKVH